MLEIATDFSQKLVIGLSEENTEVKCLPTYIYPSPDRISGTAYVMDLGGSNLRASVVSIHDNDIRFLAPVKSVEIPWQRNIPFPREKLLAMQADLIRSLDFPDSCPMGYCFSYPTTSIANGDATLIRWTKGIHVPSMVGQRIGEMLVAYIRQHHAKVKIPFVSVLNDTVASLFAGLAGDRKDAYIGLIVGTGTNMAAFFPSGQIPKLGKEIAPQKDVPINLECGNFNPLFLTKWDQMVDADSENPKEQRFEKAVSGMYLGRIFKVVFPDSDFDASSGAQGLVEILSAGYDLTPDQKMVAHAIYERSAHLVAAQLAGLVKVLCAASSTKTIKIVAEGGLFWSQIRDEKPYAQSVRQHLDALLRKMNLHAITVEFSNIHQANLAGAAVAALSVNV